MYGWMGGWVDGWMAPNDTKTKLLMTKQCIVTHVIKKLMKYNILKDF